MDFKIYNTLNKKKETFIPIDKNTVKLYTCGPTVYNFAHVGNLRTYIFEDILKKSLYYIGYNVTHVMNITDVGHLESDGDQGEDKMALGADREKKSILEIARFYEEAFFKDCKRLNIEKPSIACKATEHINDMINLIQVLEKKGFTYISNGNVYFSIDKYPHYNKLANLTIEELKSGTRVEIDLNKKNPLDFVLWFTNSKFTNQILQWESPWGKGFPGWHIECSAMSIKYLGELIDIHCGGIDHIPVHHTNEIAQSECALGHRWVNYWMHGEFIVLNKTKMSKSGGNFITLDKLIESGFDSLDYRYFCLQSRYRKQLTFSFESLKESQKALKKLKSKINYIYENADDNEKVDFNNIKNYQENFTLEICDDLNIPNAFTVLFDVIKDQILNNKEKIYLINDFDKVFCLDLLSTRNLSTYKDNKKNEELINKLIVERKIARENKDWIRADEIRNILTNYNIEVIDTNDGTTWRYRT